MALGCSGAGAGAGLGSSSDDNTTLFATFVKRVQAIAVKASNPLIASCPDNHNNIITIILI